MEKTVDILGTPLRATTYGRLLDCLKERAKQDAPFLVDFSNTHIVALRRHRPDFFQTTKAIDYFVPDGMPLVWCMNLRGAGLRDRVYGPSFMKHCIESTPAPWKHFFFGGTQQMLEDLKRELLRLQPDLQIAGMLAPKFGQWTDEENEFYIGEINGAGADFVWLALGGGRQQEWMASQRSHFKRGNFLTVGDAFPLLARHRSFAPAWMQKAGLTWLHRVIHSPVALGSRYFTYNSLFVAYCVRDFFSSHAKKIFSHRFTRMNTD